MSVSQDDFDRLAERVNALEALYGHAFTELHTHRERFDRLDAKLDGLDRKVGAGLDALGARLDARVDDVGRKLDDLGAEVRAQLREILRRLPN